MSKKEKLIQRFNSNPRDFTFEELVTLMGYYGYKLNDSGKTGGSRVRFEKNGCQSILMHRPHAYKCLLVSAINDVKKTLMEEESI